MHERGTPGGQRGTGESIWDVREHLSWISADIILAYRINVSCVDTVLSGLFDSVGLYRVCSEEQVRLAELWLKEFGLLRYRNDKLGHLSFGEQTLVLLARAMIKNPDILILDEPLQGRDPVNRRKLVADIQGIALSSCTSILCVTHHPELFAEHLFSTLDLTAKDTYSIPYPPC